MKDQRPISANTRICAVIGNPVAHSLSPAIHNAAFDHLGLDYVYVAFRVEDLRGAMAGVRALENFRGLSVTIPHKIEVLRYVDEVAAEDRAIGSINTVIREDGRLIGLGTDGPGALRALAEGEVEIDGRNVLFLGAGGAARAIAFTLAQRAKPGELTILDINEPMLRGLQADLAASADVPVRAEPLTEASLAAAMARAEVIVHCTSVGMHPREDASLIPPELFRAGQAVFDIVYTPLETKLLSQARSRGLKTVSGAEMFLHQAVLQFKHFTGVDAPVAVMRGVLMEQLGAWAQS